MDINILNSGTPNSKNWLNPVCNVITCNQLITIPSPLNNSAFNLNFTGQSQLISDLTNPCDTIGIPNANVSLAANTYTAPNDLNLFVTLQLSIFYPVGVDNFTTAVFILINGISSYLSTGSQNTGANVDGRYPLICTGILSLLAGDVVSIRVISLGSLVGANYGNVSFSGSIL
jgi:hypothetical protein